MATFDDIRQAALALPEADEAPHFEATAFRVRTKIFCTADPEGVRMTLKLGPEDQHNLVTGHADIAAAVEGYWGRKGWTVVDASNLDPAALETWLTLAWASVAPKKLVEAMARS